MIKNNKISKVAINLLDTFINKNGINNPSKRLSIRQNALEIKKELLSDNANKINIEKYLKNLKINILNINTKWKKNKLLNMLNSLKEKLMEEEFIEIINNDINIENNKYLLNDKIFTTTELRKYNGMKGRPLYVAVNGIVYDLTKSTYWQLGSHFGLLGGRDLTEHFNKHHTKTGTEYVLKRFKAIGKIKHNSEMIINRYKRDKIK